MGSLNPKVRCPVCGRQDSLRSFANAGLIIGKDDEGYILIKCKCDSILRYTPISRRVIGYLDRKTAARMFSGIKEENGEYQLPEPHLGELNLETPNEDIEFILEKIRYGLSSEHINQPMTDEDLERLNWPAEDYNKLPESEWNKWSKKIHCALQVAFSDDTSRSKDIDKVNEWRKRLMSVVQNSLAKDESEYKTLENAAFHFLTMDLLHHALDILGYNNLTEEEQKMIYVFSDATKSER